ncbi:MAG: hypothetical protein FJ379_11425 [Verrucomicrobia bacterium]|nr:hypothetical protein [Verrucomicrobiota bacterium]
MRSFEVCAVLALGLLLELQLGGAGPMELPDPSKVPMQSLKWERTWTLTPPDASRFDASALLRLADGTLLTVNDKQAGLYRIEGLDEGSVARLELVPDVFTKASLDAACGQTAPAYDLEGLAIDDQGRFYVCDEISRHLFRFDPKTRKTERLATDWSPVRKWISEDGNASWEGLAIGGGQLFLANERNVGRIVVISMSTWKVQRTFSVSPPDRPARDVHYSDLCWNADRLWVLCRESQCILRVEPGSGRVEAAFGYGAIERDPKHGYLNPLPVGFVEGLAVQADTAWLLVDNNGIGRIADPKDVRPTLWRCRMPEPRRGVIKRPQPNP